MMITIRELNETIRKLKTTYNYLETKANADTPSEDKAMFLDAADLLFEYREKLLNTKIDI